MEQERSYRLLINILLVFAAGFFLLRFLPALRFALFGGLVVFALGAIGYLLYRAYQKRQKQKAHQATFQGQIEQRIAECRVKVAGFETEVEGIDQSRRELADQLARTQGVSTVTSSKAQKLLTELDEERALRQSKLNFFNECIQRLESLLQQHLLNEALAAKESELDRLKAGNYDDVAEMENIRYQLEQDQIRLETIADLSHRAAHSPNLNQTERLRKELDQIRA